MSLAPVIASSKGHKIVQVKDSCHPCGYFSIHNARKQEQRAKQKHIDGEGTSDGDGIERTEADSSTFSRQPSMTKVKRLIRRRTIKLLASTRHRGLSPFYKIFIRVR